MKSLTRTWRNARLSRQVRNGDASGWRRAVRDAGFAQPRRRVGRTRVRGR